jgi:hypothetical protein
MFQFYDITDRQRQELNLWSDSVIESNKLSMSSDRDYLIWSNRLYYQPGKDTWVDESWWTNIAQKLFIKHKDDYDGLGTAVIPALEILVHYFPEQYTDYARDKIDRWYDELGYHDPEYWWDLIVVVYPDHPVTEFLFEEQENTWEGSIAIRLGDRKTIIQTKEYLLSDLEDGDIYMTIQNLSKFNKSSFYEVFSQSESNTLELEMLEIAERYILADSRDWIDLYYLLKSAIELEWQKTIDCLLNNIKYLTKVLNQLLFENYSSDNFLLWSLANKYELTENLVFQLHPGISDWRVLHRIDFPSYEFALAIAWKRSQSKV